MPSIKALLVISGSDLRVGFLRVCDQAVVTICNQVVADVRFSNVDKFTNAYKSSNGAYLNLATVLEPQNIGFEAL